MDSGNYRVQEFSGAGAPDAHWGTQGSGAGQVAWPSAWPTPPGTCMSLIFSNLEGPGVLYTTRSREAVR